MHMWPTCFSYEHMHVLVEGASGTPYTCKKMWEFKPAAVD